MKNTETCPQRGLEPGTSGAAGKRATTRPLRPGELHEMHNMPIASNYTLKLSQADGLVSCSVRVEFFDASLRLSREKLLAKPTPL